VEVRCVVRASNTEAGITGASAGNAGSENASLHRHPRWQSPLRSLVGNRTGAQDARYAWKGVPAGIREYASFIDNENTPQIRILKWRNPEPPGKEQRRLSLGDPLVHVAQHRVDLLLLPRVGTATLGLLEQIHDACRIAIYSEIFLRERQQ
jgi:hypothetical protein